MADAKLEGTTKFEHLLVRVDVSVHRIEIIEKELIERRKTQIDLQQEKRQLSIAVATLQGEITKFETDSKEMEKKANNIISAIESCDF